MLVELTPNARERSYTFCEPHTAESEWLFHRYTREQLELLLKFVRGSGQFNETHAAELERANREARPD